MNNVSGLLIFIFSVSLLFYFLMRKYLNVYTSEEEKLRYAITVVISFPTISRW